MRLGVEASLVGHRLVPGDVEVEDSRIRAYGLPSANGRGVAAPGFVDLQVNGFGGVDFLDADAAGYRRAGDALLATGVTAYLPTLITAPEERLIAALREVPPTSGPRILGVHLEGPFIAPARLGAHPPEHRRDPDRALLDRLLDAGPVRLMTLAPELVGADELIDRLRGRGVTVSAGHSDATAEQATAFFDRGIRTVTHLFNAMRPFHHRDPGVAGAALARDDVLVQLICDGVHVAPEVVRVVWRAAARRTALVTDAVAGATRTPEGVLAGSTLTMLDAVRNLHALGVPLAEALDAATAAPARVIGDASVGRLDVGRRADVVVLNDNLDVVRVLVAGDELFAS